jgi:hypothetical protein
MLKTTTREAQARLKTVLGTTAKTYQFTLAAVFKI